MTDSEKVGYCTDIWAAVEYGHGRAAQCAALDVAIDENSAELRERIRELEDALLEELTGGRAHAFYETCPVAWEPFRFDARCPACQRLERLIGHRKPE